MKSLVERLNGKCDFVKVVLEFEYIHTMGNEWIINEVYLDGNLSFFLTDKTINKLKLLNRNIDRELLSQYQKFQGRNEKTIELIDFIPNNYPTITFHESEHYVEYYFTLDKFTALYESNFRKFISVYTGNEKFIRSMIEFNKNEQHNNNDFSIMIAEYKKFMYYYIENQCIELTSSKT